MLMKEFGRDGFPLIKNYIKEYWLQNSIPVWAGLIGIVYILLCEEFITKTSSLGLMITNVHRSNFSIWGLLCALRYVTWDAVLFSCLEFKAATQVMAAILVFWNLETRGVATVFHETTCWQNHQSSPSLYNSSQHCSSMPMRAPSITPSLKIKGLQGTNL